MGRKVVYICDKKVDLELDKIDQIKSRSYMVNHLVSSYGLMSRMTVMSSKPASEDDLVTFHSRSYVEYMQSVNDADDLEKHEEQQDEFGLGYDCPLLKGMYGFATAVAGSSVTAAQTLVDGTADAAINWYGGWHHAQRDCAEGFCYVNDIVCAIHKLQEKFKYVLYIDLDIHHGNGVENAFAFTQSVMVLSMHKYDVGFYPCSGAVTDVGAGRGKYFSVNVPLKDGIRDQPYFALFDRVAGRVFRTFKPDAVVVQCGADSLTGDPLGTFNLTAKGLGHCVQRVLSWQVPALFLGGGGYKPTNAARYWTFLTAIIADCSIPSDIPDNPWFLSYGPDFTLDLTPSHRQDCNTKDYIENLIRDIEENLKQISKNKKTSN